MLFLLCALYCNFGYVAARVYGNATRAYPSPDVRAKESDLHKIAKGLGRGSPSAVAPENAHNFAQYFTKLCFSCSLPRAHPWNFDTSGIFVRNLSAALMSTPAFACLFVRRTSYDFVP